MIGLYSQLLDRYRKDEEHRLLHNMKVAQLSELQNIEKAQQIQFIEFSEAWDKYIADFEVTALDMMGKLKIKHDEELANLWNVTH